MKRIISIWVFCLTTFCGLAVSCSTPDRVVSKNNKKVERKADRRSGGNYPIYTAEEYIDRFSKIAVKKMKSDGIPASITLAQAMLESANGNSSLARFANNHFGIKCTPDWKGKKYYKDDDKRNDCFRVYKDPESSFYDHTEFLKRPRYQALFKLKSTDYKGWAHGLKKCGYATDPNYPQMLINLIERYDLHKYDRRGKRKQIAKSHQNNSPTTKSKSGSTPSNGRYHTVEQGDTLYRISQKYGIPVEQLMRINNLRNSTIYPGQKLNIP